MYVSEDLPRDTRYMRTHTDLLQGQTQLQIATSFVNFRFYYSYLDSINVTRGVSSTILYHCKIVLNVLRMILFPLDTIRGIIPTDRVTYKDFGP